jgi:hypothetical protein
MIFNQSNITNRTVLARCCFADMVIDMMEARAIGDTDTYECKKRKAMFLNYAIGEMCTYIDEGIFNANVGDDPTAQAYVAVNEVKFPTGNTRGVVDLTALRFGGDSGVDIATPGRNLTPFSVGWGKVAWRLSEDVNSYTRANKYTDGIYKVKSTFKGVVYGDDENTITTTITYDRGKFGAASASSVAYSDSAGTAVTRSLDSDSKAPTSASSSFTNNMARKFLNQMDELCGCPCGCSAAKILDDNLPKYI